MEQPQNRRSPTAAPDALELSRDDLLREIDRLNADLVEARQQSRVKEDSLSMASHELATPLTSLKAYIEALLEHWGDPKFDKGREFLEVLERETTRLARIVERTLQAARARAQEQELQCSAFDMFDLVADVSRALAPFLEDRIVQVAVEGPALMPAVFADRDLMAQALINLVHNAAKFSRPGTRVLVRLEVVGDRLELAVCDEGIGIPAEEVGRIFEPYYRGHVQPPDCDGGSGLGLAIVHRIVERHRGAIRVETVVDQGTTFFISIPQAHWVAPHAS